MLYPHLRKMLLNMPLVIAKSLIEGDQLSLAKRANLERKRILRTRRKVAQDMHANTTYRKPKAAQD